VQVVADRNLAKWPFFVIQVSQFRFPSRAALLACTIFVNFTRKSIHELVFIAVFASLKIAVGST